MYNIVEYGAVPGMLCTEAIQNAINACTENGGGRVVIPAGTYHTGTLWLKDHVELHLESGAVLKASTNLMDYNADDAYPQNWGCPPEKWNARHLILCVEQNDVSITGYGVIDGSGDAFFGEERIPCGGYAWEGGYVTSKDPVNLRPGQLVCFIESANVRVENVTITNATCWCCYFYGCEWVQVRGLQVKNPFAYVNTDGIDLDCCRNAVVSDCMISTGDDAIAIRCSQDRLQKKQPCENIAITNCCLASNSSAFRIGVGTGTIRHVSISNLVVHRAGTLFTSNTSFGGNGCARIDDILVNGVTAYHVGSLIDANVFAGSVSRCTHENMRVSALSGGMLIGRENGPLSDITLRNIDLFIENGPHKCGETHIFHLNGAENVRLDTIRVQADMTYWEGECQAVDCEALTVRNCSFAV